MSYQNETHSVVECKVISGLKEIDDVGRVIVFGIKTFVKNSTGSLVCCVHFDDVSDDYDFVCELVEQINAGGVYEVHVLNIIEDALP